MSKINKALYEIEKLSNLAQEDTALNRISALAKLIATVLYIALVVSFDKYDVLGVLSFALYPLVIFLLGEISFKDALYRLRFIIPIVCIMGIFNPIFDRATTITVFGYTIASGWVSFFTLMIKGVLTVFASYFLIATTTIEKICQALRQIHIPKIIVTEILLIYRYIFVLLDEVKKITLAYSLRAPGQKGIHFKVWGSLVGNLFLRTMDRSTDVYEAMCLRGFSGDFTETRTKKSAKQIIIDLIYFVGLSTIFICFRIFPIFTLVGNFIGAIL